MTIPAELIDPDLLEARELVGQVFHDLEWFTDAKHIRAGNADSYSSVLVALAALRRGRELPFVNRPTDFELGIVARDTWQVERNWPEVIRAVLTSLGIGTKP